MTRSFPRIFLGLVSGLFGMLMIAIAPELQPTAHYLFGGFCFAVAISSITDGQVGRFAKSCVALVVFVTSIWFAVDIGIATQKANESLVEPPFVLALSCLAVFGGSSASYIWVARFGLNEPKSESEIAAYSARTDAVFGWIAVGFFIFAPLLAIGSATSYWVMLLPPGLVALLYLKRWTSRKISLSRKGYYRGSMKGDYWVYEERQGSEIRSLAVGIVNTEPGHWEIFMPSELDWNETMPEWALGGRTEIGQRIAEGWSAEDFHIEDSSNSGFREN
jgi:hypothetical protein